MPASLRARPSRRHIVGALIATLCAAALTPSASAGTYSVRQCDYAMGITHHDAVWQWAGTVAGGQHSVVPHQGWNCGEFGLALRNNLTGSGVTHANGAYGGFYFYAPNGTYFTRASGMFGTVQGCCVNGMAAYADVTQNQNGSGAVGYPFRGNLPDGSFSPPSSGLGGPVGRSWDSSVSGFVGKRFGVFLRCGPGFSCSQLTSGDVRVRGRSFDFTLRDDVTPTLGAPGGTLFSGWLRGTQSLSFWAGDTGGGLSNMTATFGNGTALSSPSACPTVGGRYIRLTPCPLTRSATWNVNTVQLPDGHQTVTVRATDVSGRVAQQSRQLSVDNNAPAAPVSPSLDGGGGWRRANGYGLRWSNPNGQHAPIAKAHVRACPLDGGSCVTGEWAGAGITTAGALLLPRAGEWDARVWLEDAAGNADPASSSPPLRLRFDPDPPRLRFRPESDDAPAVVAVDATDTSGIAAGEIEVRRHGGSDWTALATTLRGSSLIAQVDDVRLPAGLYDVRVRAVDLAGNHATLQGPARSLPARAATRLSAAAVIRARRPVRGCPRCRRVVVRRAAEARVERGALVGIDARLTTASGQALADRPVAITVSSRDRAPRVAQARTGPDGRLTRLLLVRRSASVRISFAGDVRLRPSIGGLAIRVPAPVTIRAGRKSVAPGSSVRLSGRVRGGSIPGRGKLVEVQAHFRGRWRTISTVRSNRTGRWRFAYKFGSRAAAMRYGFRARVPSEERYPFEAGASRGVRVTVHRR